MSIFSLGKKKELKPVKLAFYLDSGRGNVRGAVIEMRKGIPHILYTSQGEQKISNESGANPSPALTALDDMLGKIAVILQKTNHKDMQYGVDEVYCILSSPFYLSHTAVIDYKNDKPVTITPRFLRSMVESSKKTIPPTHSEVELEAVRHLIHERIIDVKINGYRSEEPYNKSAKNVSLSIFRTEINQKLYTEITKLIQKYTPAPLYIDALSLASYATIRNRINSENDFLFITVGNEITEVSLVKDHALLETVSFPYGKNSFIRFIGRQLNIPDEAALSRLALYHDKKLMKAEVDALQPHIESGQAEWFSYLENSLVNLSKESSLPETMYLIVDTDLKDIFEGIPQKEGFAGQSLTPNGFSIKTLDTAYFADCCTFGLDIRFDTFLAISATFSVSAKETIKEEYPQNRTLS